MVSEVSTGRADSYELGSRMGRLHWLRRALYHARKGDTSEIAGSVAVGALAIVIGTLVVASANAFFDFRLFMNEGDRFTREDGEALESRISELERSTHERIIEVRDAAALSDREHERLQRGIDRLETRVIAR